MSVSVCMPGDFERQSAILLGLNELIEYHPRTLVDIVSVLVDHIPLLGVVENESQRERVLTLLCDWGLPAHKLHFVSLPVKGMWVRDYGPSFVRRGSDITILDAEYLETDRPNDDLAPRELAALLRVPVEHVPMILEGGNILSNGQGLCVTTNAVALRNRTRGLDQQQIEALLRKHYGFSQFMILPHLICEPTGHVDMFATFLAPDLIAVGSYDPRVDPVNCDLLNHNAAELAKLHVNGKPLRVIRIPMPTNQNSLFRSYTNVMFANGTLLMPTYGGIDDKGAEHAMEVFSSHLPGWEIVGIDATTLIPQRGALRCVSLNIPWMDAVFASHTDRARNLKRKGKAVQAA